MNVQIRKANSDEAGVLTEIAHAAKRYWGYPQHWIEYWKEDLTITPEFVSANEVHVALSDDEIAGFYAISVKGARAELEHLWVRPEHIGTGIGRELFMHAMERACALNASSVEISADPNAEGFYRRMGAKRIGEVESEVDGEPRQLPRLRTDI